MIRNSTYIVLINCKEATDKLPRMIGVQSAFDIHFVPLLQVVLSLAVGAIKLDEPDQSNQHKNKHKKREEKAFLSKLDKTIRCSPGLKDRIRHYLQPVHRIDLEFSRLEALYRPYRCPRAECSRMCLQFRLLPH